MAEALPRPHSAETNCGNCRHNIDCELKNDLDGGFEMARMIVTMPDTILQIHHIVAERCRYFIESGGRREAGE